MKFIAVTNRKISIVYLLKKKFLLDISNFVTVFLSCKSKISFYDDNGEQSLLMSLVLLEYSESNLDRSREIDKVCSKVVLFIKMGNFKESVKLSRLSR